MLVATQSSAHQPPITSRKQQIATSLEGLGIARFPQMTAFAQHFTDTVDLAVSASPASSTSASLGMVGIDSSMEQLGPILLTHPASLGKGKLNLNAIGNEFAPDLLDGESLDPLPEPGLLLLSAVPGEDGVPQQAGEQTQGAIGCESRVSHSVAPSSHGIRNFLWGD